MYPWERLEKARKAAKENLGDEDLVDIIEELVRAIIADHEWKDPDDDR